MIVAREVPFLLPSRFSVEVGRVPHIGDIRVFIGYRKGHHGDPTLWPSKEACDTCILCANITLRGARHSKGGVNDH